MLDLVMPSIRPGAEAVARVYGLTASPSDPGSSVRAMNVTAIESAQSQLPTGKGGIIQLPWMDGDIWLSSMPTLASGQKIVGAGPRGTRLRIAATDVNGVTINGANAGSTIVQTGLHDLALIGPGSGSGIGVHIKWGALDLTFSNLYVYGWGSHGIYQEDTYQVSYRDVVSQSNGGDGWNCLTNINATSWIGCRALSNAGAGIRVTGAAAPAIIGSNFESNGTYGLDLRYLFGGFIAGNDFEENVTANMYMHWRDSAGEKCNGVVIEGNNFTGGGVTPTGLILDGANLTKIGTNCWNAHTAEHIKTIASNCTRTQIHPQVYLDGATQITDGAASTQFWDYDQSNLWARISPSVMLGGSGGKVGFFGTNPATKKTVTGSRGGNGALASLLTQLAGYGLITDGSTA